MNTSKDNNFALEIFGGVKNHTKVFCVDSNGDSITYGELENKTRKFAYRLKHKYGVAPGTRVAIAIDDTVNWPVTFLSIILLGANPLLLFSNMVSKDIDAVMESSKCNHLISNTIVTDLSKCEDIHHEAHHWDDSKTCWWGLSSGSGGRYKIIVHNHASFQKLFKLANSQVGVKQDDVVLCTAKMAFPYGLAQLYWVLKNNATLCLISKTPAPSLVFSLIKQHNVTRLNIGPYLLNAMCGNKNKFSLHGIKVISSGEYLSKDLREKVSQDLDCKVYDTYGATEVWTTITFQDDPDTNDMGPILPGVESKIVEGELYIKHPLQAMMYWDDPVSTQKTFKQDWVATGDAVKIVDNRLSFLGRTDNMIKVKGTFVSLLDLEDTINSFPGVAECLVGINDTDAVPELVALVKFASEQRNVPHLRRYLRQLLPSDRIPKHIEVVTELPKTINNKLKRKVTSLIDYNK